MQYKDASERDYLLGPFEKSFLSIVIPQISPYIETYHLTLLTILWSILVVGMSFYAKNNEIGFLGLALLILLQHCTDTLDGALGRFKKTGLVYWGYFMDHWL